MWGMRGRPVAARAAKDRALARKLSRASEIKEMVEIASVRDYWFGDQHHPPRYQTDVESFLRDGLRLSAGMTRKNALARLWWGGGKGLIARAADGLSRDPGFRRSVFREYGAFVSSLRGSYITAEDVGTSPLDMAEIFRTTRFATCVPPEHDRLAGQVKHRQSLGVGGNVIPRPHGNDAAIAHRERLGSGLLRIHGDDFGVAKCQVIVEHRVSFTLQRIGKSTD